MINNTPLKVDDTIRCHDKEEMVNYSMALAQLDIETEFMYEKDGEKRVMAGNNKSEVVIPFEIENKEEVKEILDRLQKETELTEDIEQKINDVFRFMWEHGIFKIESIYTGNVKFILTVDKGAVR